MLEILLQVLWNNSFLQTTKQDSDAFSEWLQDET